MVVAFSHLFGEDLSRAAQFSDEKLNSPLVIILIVGFPVAKARSDTFGDGWSTDMVLRTANIATLQPSFDVRNLNWVLIST